MSKVST